MSTRFLQIVLLAVCLRFYVNGNEPVCSKFDYEEKLLTKMIRMEIHVEELARNMHDSLDDLNASTSTAADNVGHLQTKLQNLEVVIKNEQGRADQLETDLDKIKTAIETQAFGEESDQDRKDKSAAGKTVVAFHAHTLKGSSFSSGTTLVFSKTVFNIGGHYDDSTGIFTAPIKGIYLMSAFFCSSANNNANFAWVHNGNTVAYGKVYKSDCGSSTVTLQLEVSDVVSMQVTATSEYLEDRLHRNTLSGTLIQSLEYKRKKLTITAIY